MRISDWSSDVCSSDLIGGSRCGLPFVLDLFDGTLDVRRGDGVVGSENNRVTFAAEKLQPAAGIPVGVESGRRSEEHTSELQSLMRTSYAVFCLTKKQINHHT